LSKQRNTGAVPFQFVPQFPPEAARVLRPQQHPKTALVEPRSRTPFVVYAPEPMQVFKKTIAERGLQPCKVMHLGGHLSGVSLPTDDPPQTLSLALLDTAAHKVPAFSGQSEVRASTPSSSSAKRAISLVDHDRAIGFSKSVSREHAGPSRRMRAMSKPEGRNPKAERRPKFEGRKPSQTRIESDFRLRPSSDFGFLSDFGFRISGGDCKPCQVTQRNLARPQFCNRLSDFGFRISY